MDAPRLPTTLPPTGDFSRFWRIPEGDCELLSARYSQQSFGRHSHERYAIGVITGGVEKLFSRGRQHLCTAGSVVTITPDDIHDGVPGSAEGWIYRMLYIDPAWLNAVLDPQRLAPGYIHRFQEVMRHDPALACLFLQRHRLIESCAPSLERETLLLDLLAQVFQRNGLPIPVVAGTERQAVMRIKQRLEDDFAQHIPLEELAATVDLDPLYMIRVFKQQVGVSPHSYQIQKRIAQVQNLLRAGVSISDASLLCGFFDQSHMTRAFKKVVGVTPGHFRNSRP
jgi:AraC-like DNA-binding protein